MQGSIRIVMGLLLTMGAVGGIDAGNDLLACTALATAGLGLMFSGVNATKVY